jgi:DNA (cytosine-5)-methyltransferase 1
MLRNLGYRTAEFRCDSHKMGVAQRRHRAVAMAWRSNRSIPADLIGQSGGTLRDAIRGVARATDHCPKALNPVTRLARIAQRIRPGQKLCNVRASDRAVHTWDIPEVFGATTLRERCILEALLRLRRRHRVRDTGDGDPVTARVLSSYVGFPAGPVLRRLLAAGYIRRTSERYNLTHTFNGKPRRLRWSQPVPTVDTRFGDPWYYLHPSQNRGFTIREAARLQGFPDWFTFSGSVRARYRLIGNAVPPPLAAVLAAFVRDHLLS